MQTTSSCITAQPVNAKPQISNGPTQVEEDLFVEACFCNYRITRIAKEQTVFIQADSAFNNRTKSSKKHLNSYANIRLHLLMFRQQHIKCMSSIKMTELWEFTKQKSSMFHVILHIDTDNQ